MYDSQGRLVSGTHDHDVLQAVIDDENFLRDSTPQAMSEAQARTRDQALAQYGIPAEENDPDPLALDTGDAVTIAGIEGEYVFLGYVENEDKSLTVTLTRPDYGAALAGDPPPPAEAPAAVAPAESTDIEPPLVLGLDAPAPAAPAPVAPAPVAPDSVPLAPDAAAPEVQATDTGTDAAKKGKGKAPDENAAALTAPAG